ncbi:hypothetical protein B0H19DRAFT_1377608 [Mycena capillaripes]|nr:hypothetical protein B0H19DRAFT_1377608 [Mycena capillaripes]
MPSQAITAATNHFLQFRLQYSSLALLYYDFALTFPKEVKYMWWRKFRLSTALYIGCRYALVANVLYLLAVANKLGSTYLQCDVWYKVIGALSVIGRTAVIVTFTLRTYAVFAKNKWVLAYLGVVGLACVALDIRAPPGFLQRLPNAFTVPLSCILTARFILLLRKWDEGQLSQWGSASDTTVIGFRTTSRSDALSTILAVDDFGANPLALITQDSNPADLEFPHEFDGDPSFTLTIVPHESGDLESIYRLTTLGAVRSFYYSFYFCENRDLADHPDPLNGQAPLGLLLLLHSICKLPYGALAHHDVRPIPLQTPL